MNISVQDKDVAPKNTVSIYNHSGEFIFNLDRLIAIFGPIPVNCVNCPNNGKSISGLLGI